MLLDNRFSSDITNGPLQLFISGVGRAVDVCRLKKRKTLNVKARSRLAGSTAAVTLTGHILNDVWGGGGVMTRR